MNQNISLHERAVHAALCFKKSDAELLGILIEVDQAREYERQGYTSLFLYCTQCLKLSESHAQALSSVAKKSREVPELKAKIDEGEIHLSNARRIVSVINGENKEAWLSKASALSQRDLEREVVREKPLAASGNERIRPLSDALSELRVFLTPAQEEKLKRVKDVVAQKRQENLSLAGTLEAVFDDFIKRHDPVARAERSESAQALCPGKVEAPAMVHGKRTARPAAVTHAVNLRDQGQCTQTLPNGKRCEQRRWVEQHHVIQVANGGMHAAGNLTTLCSAHHRARHHDIHPRTGTSSSGV